MARREIDYLFDVKSAQFTEWEVVPWTTFGSFTEKRRAHTLKYLGKNMFIIYEYDNYLDLYSICIGNLVTHMHEDFYRTNSLVNDLITTNVTQTLEWQDVK
jgi:hypothetical protein